VLQCVAVCCSVLQCVAVCLVSMVESLQGACCSVLQFVAVCCSVLQCVAVCLVSMVESLGFKVYDAVLGYMEHTCLPASVSAFDDRKELSDQGLGFRVYDGC